MGLGFSKLLLLAAIVLVVWYGFKYRTRIEAVRRAFQAEAAAAAAQRGRARPAAPKLAAEDLVKCERCGSYVAARGAAACGRPDCRQGG